MLPSSQRKYIIVLALVALSILVAGLALKPKPKQPPKRRESVARSDFENLQDLVRRNSLRSLGSNFAKVSNEAALHVANVSPWNTSAVRIPTGEIVIAKSLDSLPVPVQVTTADRRFAPVMVPAWIPGLPVLVATLTADTALPPATAPSVPLETGAWLLLVGDDSSGQVSMEPAIYSGDTAADCGPYIRKRLAVNFVSAESHIGAGVFDLTGALHGILLPCGQAAAVIPVSEILNATRIASATPLLADYGMRLDGDPSRPTVEEVWDAWPADTAGIEPGDVVISVDNKQVANASDAIQRLAPSDQPRHLLLRRGPRIMRASLAQVQPAPAAVGIDSGSQEQGILLREVLPGSSAGRSGLRSGDRILFLDGRAATAQSVQVALSAFRTVAPVEVEVRRGRRRFLTVVTP